MKEFIKPNKNFINFFNKAEEARKDMPKFLAKMTGYNENFCKKNISKAMEALNEEQKEEIDNKFIYAQVIKQHLWAKFYYLNFEKIKDYLLPPATVLYNEKKKVIELSDDKEMQAKLKRLVSDFKNVIGKFSQKNNKISPTKNI